MIAVVFEKKPGLAVQKDMPGFVKERKPQMVISLVTQAQLNQGFVRRQPSSRARHTRSRQFRYKNYRDAGRRAHSYQFTLK